MRALVVHSALCATLATLIEPLNARFSARAIYPVFLSLLTRDTRKRVTASRLDIKFYYGKDKNFASVIVKRFYCVSPPILGQSRNKKEFTPSIDEGALNKF